MSDSEVRPKFNQAACGFKVYPASLHEAFPLIQEARDKQANRPARFRPSTEGFLLFPVIQLPTTYFTPLPTPPGRQPSLSESVIPGEIYIPPGHPLASPSLYGASVNIFCPNCLASIVCPDYTQKYPVPLINNRGANPTESHRGASGSPGLERTILNMALFFLSTLPPNTSYTSCYLHCDTSSRHFTLQTGYPFTRASPQRPLFSCPVPPLQPPTARGGFHHLCTKGM
ncbi:unnamed protein product [Protopolystoma xenopodis]|uniref:Uncharacterized protein n=1 Tax=Protopolystoma xenopodis TaxID=117903 RepID=A0A3S5A933_9PLAT|nr:unnamed protein product [Protopolystoma xenopodis]